MAKVSLQKNHDWIGIKATFPSGHVANVTGNRGGMNVTVTPSMPREAEALSIIVDQACKRTREPGYVASDYGEMFDIMGAVGKATSTLSGYLDGLKEALSVPGPAARTETVGAGGTAKATKKRGWVVDATLPDGTKVELSINKNSVGCKMVPEVSSNANAIMKLIFGIKQVGAHDDESIANTLVDTATRSADVIDWVANARAAFMSPAPRM